jgi:polysaccharide chain length determinant protein (PEP-CTERM system associated)
VEQFHLLAQEYGAAIWRRRWLALATAWVICLAGWFAVFSIPNQYEASARLYVDADAVLTPLLKGIALDDSATSQLDILQRTLLSRPNLEKLISKTDLELRIAGPADLERLTADLARKIKVTLATRNLFTISYRDPDPKLAYNVVQTVLAIFIESKAGTNRTDMANARQFLEQQIASYEQQLRRTEARRADFRVRYMDLLPNDVYGGQSKLEQSRAALAQLQGQLTDESKRLALLQQALTTTPPVLTSDSPEGAAVLGSGGSNGRLAQAELDLDRLRQKYTENHPDVQSAKAYVETLRKHGGGGSVGGGTRRSSVPNPLYAQLKGQIFESQSKVDSLERQVADETRQRDRMEEIARSAPGLQAEFTDLERGYDVLRKNYEQLLARRESMRLAAAADTEAAKVKTQVVDPPTVPQIAISPNRPLLLAAVLVFGLAGGLGLPILLHQFDTSPRNLEQLRSFELPVLGSISLIERVMPLRRRVLDLAGLATTGLVLLALFGGLLAHTLRVSA